MTTKHEKLLTKVQIYKEGKVGGRNKMQIRDARLSEFIRITDKKLKRTIDITWNVARADTLQTAIARMKAAKSNMCLRDRIILLDEIELLEKELKRLTK